MGSIRYRLAAFSVGAVLVFASVARAADGTVAGGSGAVHVKGEADAYRIATPKASVSLQAKTAGDLTLKIRGVLPAGSIPSEGAKVRILENGTELAHLSLSIYASGTSSDRADVVPSGSSSRTFHLGDGPHVVTVETKGSNAAVFLHWKGVAKKGGGHHEVAAAKPAHESAHTVTAAAAPAPAPAPAAALEPIESPEAAPLDGSSAPPPSPNAAPLVNVPKPAPISQIAERPAPVPSPAFESPSSVTVSPSDQGKPVLPLILVGAAVVCAVGAGVTLGLGVSQDSSYNAAPESPSRAGMLNTANGEIAVAEILGAATAAFLVATGVSLLF